MVEVAKNKHEHKPTGKFSDKHPIIGLLVITYGSYLVAQFLIGLILFVLLQSKGVDQTVAMTIGAIIGSFIVLIFWYKKTSPIYRFMPRTGDVTGSIKLMWPILIYWGLMYLCYFILANGFRPGAITFATFMTCLMAGLSEEIIFREIAISYMTKHFRGEKVIPVIATASGLMFGLIHLTNAIGKGNFTGTMFQALLSILFGFFFSAIYLRKGNVWILMLAHFLHDVIVFIGSSGLENAGFFGDFPIWLDAFFIISELGLAIYGYYLIRPAKRPEILQLWDYKWSRD